MGIAGSIATATDPMSDIKMRCPVEDKHFGKVKVSKYFGFPLCWKHWLLLRCGATLKMRAKVNTKDWKYVVGKIEP